jgi:hypothetical protein
VLHIRHSPGVTECAAKDAHQVVRASSSGATPASIPFDQRFRLILPFRSTSQPDTDAAINPQPAMTAFRITRTMIVSPAKNRDGLPMRFIHLIVPDAPRRVMPPVRGADRTTGDRE